MTEIYYMIYYMIYPDLYLRLEFNIAMTQQNRIKYRTVMSRTTRAHLKEEGRWFDEGSN